MQLRTRISIIITLMLALVCASIIYASYKREQLINTQFSEELLTDVNTVWKKVIEEFVRNLEQYVYVVDGYYELADALANRDFEQVHEIGTLINYQLQTLEGVDRFDLIFDDGSLAYSTYSDVFQSPLIVPVTSQVFMAENRQASGVGNDIHRNIAIVFALPLFSSYGTVSGMAVFATDIVHAIEEMERLTGSTVMIVNRRGRLIVASSENNEWKRFRPSVDVTAQNTVQVIESEDQYFSVSVLPMVADLAGLLGRLVIVKDKTEFFEQQQQIQQTTLIVVVIFLVLLLTALNVYMKRSFVPLDEGVNVLRALSRGDLRAQIEHGIRKDEVGQIASAVNVFRSNLVTLNRIRRSRERQRARQERFIFREMKQLADTLDGEARDELLEELKEIGEFVEKKPTKVIARGNDKQVSESSENANEQAKTQESLGLMAMAFQSMSNRVQDQHQRLREAIKTRETLIALRNELDIATRVQLSLIPKQLNISISYNAAGHMTPAKEVGGDFFDIFRLSKSRLGVAIADVSGKGVPAALFMVLTRTLLRSTVLHLEEPQRVLSSMNDYLEQNNDEQLFVTLCYGILDETTGEFTYSTGGHNPPIVADSKGTRMLEPAEGTVLAMIDQIDFGQRTVFLEINSRLIMMTDGLPEAFNAHDEAFGDNRVLEVIAGLENSNPEDDMDELIGSINKFVGDAPQFDDMTCIVLHFQRAKYAKAQDEATSNGEERSKMINKDQWVIEDSTSLTLEIKNDLSEIQRVAGEVERFAEQNQWPDSWSFKINLALDELITNIINYGIKDSELKEITLVISNQNGDAVVILEDTGVAFNPLVEADMPDLDATVEERPIGGLGIHMVKTVFDEIAYERNYDRNQLTMILHA